jgi:hypothetical protein
MKNHLALPDRKFGDGIMIGKGKQEYIYVSVPKDYKGVTYSRPGGVKRYVYQHRLIMEKILGRYLKRSEIVHHKNGIKYDNREENLELIVKKSEHHIKRVKCPKCNFEFRISGKFVGREE